MMGCGHPLYLSDARGFVLKMARLRKERAKRSVALNNPCKNAKVLRCAETKATQQHQHFRDSPCLICVNRRGWVGVQSHHSRFILSDSVKESGNLLTLVVAPSLWQVSSKDEDFLDLSVDVEQNTSITHCLR